ncbi:MAG: hypothetical protein DYG96_08880 [Chlorobi bacterium CHB2]|nr:hypothetical protein [Chlorobi bacterium CHB2]
MLILPENNGNLGIAWGSRGNPKCVRRAGEPHQRAGKLTEARGVGNRGKYIETKSEFSVISTVWNGAFAEPFGVHRRDSCCKQHHPNCRIGGFPIFAE